MKSQRTGFGLPDADPHRLEGALFGSFSMSDTLSLTPRGLSQSWRSIRVLEILDRSTYIPSEAEELMGDILDLGRPLDEAPSSFRRVARPMSGAFRRR